MGRGGRIGVTVFLAFWIAIPSFMLVVLSREALETGRRRAWKPTACVILESGVLEPNAQKSSSYAFAVRYRYTWQGRNYTSDRFSAGGKSSANYSDVQQLAERYPVDAQRVCYVNPAAPQEAVLERPSPWFLAIALVPLGFVAFGLVALYWVWRRPPAPVVGLPLSNKPSATAGPGCLILFFSVFLLAGLAATYFLLLQPVWRMIAARGWQQTPCVILSSRVVTHADSDGSTYSVDILYSYAFEGREFKANRYDFMTGSTSGRAGKESIVRRYPPGTRTVCYVNPKNPAEAVLQRGATSTLWFGLLPLIFVAVGAGGITFAARAALRAGQGAQSRRSKERRRADSGLPVSGQRGPVLLRSAKSRVGKFIGAVLIAAFWNGIVSVFVWQVIKSFQRGRPEWFLTVFMIPFVLVGLALLGVVVHGLLLLFAPGVKLRLGAAALAPGGSTELEWEINGRAGAIKQLRLWLEGREEATYRRGTNTATAKATFATLELAKATVWNDIRHGRARLSLPAGTMHSFASAHNKIVWALHVHGEIAFYPDINDEFPITVLPAPPSARPQP